MATVLAALIWWSGFIQGQTRSLDPKTEARMSGRKRSPSHGKAARPCSNWRRSAIGQEASKTYQMRIIISIPSAIAHQKPMPTSQEVATTWAPETRIPSAVTAVPASPIPRALVAAGLLI